MATLLDRTPALGPWARRGARIVVGYSPAAERALRRAADEAGCRCRRTPTG